MVLKPGLARPTALAKFHLVIQVIISNPRNVLAIVKLVQFLTVVAVSNGLERATVHVKRSVAIAAIILSRALVWPIPKAAR